MSQVINFLVENWKIIAMVALCIFELVIFLVKKKPQVNLCDHIKSLVDEFAPSFIILAEMSGTTGSEKLSFVVKSLMDKIKKFVSSKDEDFWKSYIIKRVEAILSTPQKKEGK